MENQQEIYEKVKQQVILALANQKIKPIENSMVIFDSIQMQGQWSVTTVSGQRLSRKMSQA